MRTRLPTIIGPALAVGLFMASPLRASEEQFSEEVHFTECTPENFLGCLDGTSTAVTNSTGIRVIEARQTRKTRDASAEAEEISRADANGITTHLAAGDGDGTIDVWANFSHTDFDSDFVNELGANLAYAANTDAGTVGMQRLLQDRLLLGVALGYETTAIFTEFNGGDTEADGFLITPYAAYLINDHVSLDLSFGYTTLDYEQLRVADDTGAPVRGDFDADRWFINPNIAVFGDSGRFVYSAHAGILYVEENQDAYAETGNSLRMWTPTAREVSLTQLTLGAEGAYAAEVLEPYAYVTYRNDLSRKVGLNAGGLPTNIGSVLADDDDEFELGIGLRAAQREGPWSGGIEFNYITGRQDFDGWSIAVTGRVAF